VKSQQIAFALVLTHLWALMISFGGILFVTIILYPNVFHDVPRSLETTMAFAVVRGPSDFFAPVGLVAAMTGLGFLILGWRAKSARYWVLGGVLILVVGEILFSMVFFWPRNTIMFVEGTAVHPAGYLNQVAQEFQAGQWFRVALTGMAAASSFIGFLKSCRSRITSDG
jgi:hypothetical protein